MKNQDWRVINEVTLHIPQNWIRASIGA